MTSDELDVLQELEHHREEARKYKRRSWQWFGCAALANVGMVLSIVSGPSFNLPRDLSNWIEDWRRPAILTPLALPRSILGSNFSSVSSVWMPPITQTGMTLQASYHDDSNYSTWDALSVWDTARPDSSTGCYLAKQVLVVKQDGTAVWYINSSDAAAVESAANACGMYGGIVRALAKR